MRKTSILFALLVLVSACEKSHLSPTSEDTLIDIELDGIVRTSATKVTLNTTSGYMNWDTINHANVILSNSNMLYDVTGYSRGSDTEDIARFIGTIPGSITSSVTFNVVYPQDQSVITTTPESNDYGVNVMFDTFQEYTLDSKLDPIEITATIGKKLPLISTCVTLVNGETEDPNYQLAFFPVFSMFSIRISQAFSQNQFELSSDGSNQPFKFTKVIASVEAFNSSNEPTKVFADKLLFDINDFQSTKSDNWFISPFTILTPDSELSSTVTCSFDYINEVTMSERAQDGAGTNSSYVLPVFTPPTGDILDDSEYVNSDDLMIDKIGVTIAFYNDENLVAVLYRTPKGASAADGTSITIPLRPGGRYDVDIIQDDVIIPSEGQTELDLYQEYLGGNVEDGKIIIFKAQNVLNLVEI